MRKFVLAIFVVALGVASMGASCSPLERDAYNTAVGAKAFLDSEKTSNNCATDASSKVCGMLAQGVAAKDGLLDAIAVYCAGPTFNAGGACNPPAKGTPAAVQATAKLQAALTSYKTIAAEIKVASGGK